MKSRSATATPGCATRQLMALICLVALAAGAPVGASAADKQKTAPMLYRYTARTAGPILKKGVVKAAGIEWTCRDQVCTASGPWPATGVKACQALAGEVGRIVEYGRPGAKLAASDLERCNQFLPAAAGLPKKVKQPAPTAGGAAAEAVAPASTSVPAGLRSRRGQPPPVADRKTVKPMTLAKGPPLLPPSGDAGGDGGGQDSSDFLSDPLVLAGIVAAAIAIPLATADDPDCDDVRITAQSIALSEAPGDAPGTYVISWTTDPRLHECYTWGIVIFCDLPGQESLFPEELTLNLGDAAYIQRDLATGTYSISWTRPARFPPECVLRLVVGAGEVDMP